VRVTFNGNFQSGLAAINQAAEQFNQSQWQVATGKRLRAPSDDPAAAQGAIQQQAEIGALDSYSRASNGATARLSVLDSALGDIVDRLTQAMTAAEGVHGSIADQTQRDSASVTLGGIRDAIARDINSTYNGQYVFSGSKSDAQSYLYTAGAWVYQGNATPMTVDVGRGRAVSLAVDGQTILQGTDTTDVLTVLDGLVTATQTGDNTATQTGIDALKRAFDRATRAQSQVGADEASVSDGQQRLASLRLAATTRLSQAQDANLADAITSMNRAQTTYQAALGAVSTAAKVSLLDYL